MKLPELNVDYGNLYTMFFSPIRLKLLLTGIELKIFNHLTNPTSAEDVAQKINTHPNNTKILLNGLAAIDLVNKKNNLYQNTPVAQTFLVEDNQTYLGQLLVFMATSEPELENLTKLVKEGPPKKLKQPPFSEDLLTKTAEMMANIEVAGDAQQLLQIVSELPEYNKFKKMLDLGGGPGLIGLAIVNSHPTLKVQVAIRFLKTIDLEFFARESPHGLDPGHVFLKARRKLAQYIIDIQEQFADLPAKTRSD